MVQEQLRRMLKIKLKNIAATTKLKIFASYMLKAMLSVTC